MAYLSIVALIPLAAVVFKAFDGGWDTFWNAISTPQATYSLRLTLIASLIVVLVNAVAGTIIAWVLVRDEFPGKSIVNSLIDLPFALPTIVAGLTLLAFYGPDSPVGVNLAFTVDQGNTKVEVNSLPQGSLMDVTQLGGMASFDSGPWTLGVAGVYGFGHIRSSRFDTGGESVASYGTKMWGMIAEGSYYWQIQSFRVVPKAGFDHTHVSVDSYEESGGAVPVFGTAQTTDRSRVYGALELGYTVQPATAVYDFSVYGKLYDIVSQRVTPVVASAVVGGFTPITVPAAIDERLEYATGASVSVRVAAARLYLNYDGRFRRSFDSHGGTVGLEVRW